MSLTLHSYWRATAPYRVRIGLNLKGLDYGYVGVNLLKGEQHADDYVATRNRQHLTPALHRPRARRPPAVSRSHRASGSAMCYSRCCHAA